MQSNRSYRIDKFHISYYNYLKDRENNITNNIKESINNLIETGRNNLINNNYTEGFKFYEKAINKNIKLLKNKKSLKNILNNYIKLLNNIAVYNMNSNNYDAAYLLVSKAENIIVKYNIKNLILRSLTYNNLSLYYRKNNKIVKSNYYLNKSKLELLLCDDKTIKSNPDIIFNKLITSISQASIYSQMNKFIN